MCLYMIKKKITRMKDVSEKNVSVTSLLLVVKMSRLMIS